jgi:hypothetical protein
VSPARHPFTTSSPETGPRPRFPAEGSGNAAVVRTMFWVYVAVIAVGLIAGITTGLAG